MVAYVVLAAVAVWALRSPRSRPAYAAFVVLALAALASVTWPISALRYVGALFPVFIAWADVGRDRRVRLASVAISIVLLGTCTAVFVSGGWAF